MVIIALEKYENIFFKPKVFILYFVKWLIE